MNNISKKLNKYLSSVFSCKKKNRFFAKIVDGCYLVVQVESKRNFVTKVPNQSRYVVNNGRISYDIIFSIILNDEETVDFFDYDLNYSLCTICGKQPSDWSEKTGVTSEKLVNEMKEMFFKKCYAPIFEQNMNVYYWTKEIVKLNFKNKPMFLDEMYFMYDFAKKNGEDKEVEYWYSSIQKQKKTGDGTVSSVE